MLKQMLQERFANSLYKKLRTGIYSDSIFFVLRQMYRVLFEGSLPHLREEKET
jgi:hypothetical protein